MSLLRRRMMMQTAAINVRTDLEVNNAGDVICNIQGRLFTKTYDGKAIRAYFYRKNERGTTFTTPLIVADNERAATVSRGNNVYAPNLSFTYAGDGKMYYVGQWSDNWAAKIRETSGTNCMLLKNGKVFVIVNGLSTFIQAATVLLDIYYGRDSND